MTFLVDTLVETMLHAAARALLHRYYRQEVAISKATLRDAILVNAHYLGVGTVIFHPDMFDDN